MDIPWNGIIPLKQNKNGIKNVPQFLENVILSSFRYEKNIFRGEALLSISLRSQFCPISNKIKATEPFFCNKNLYAKYGLKLKIITFRRKFNKIQNIRFALKNPLLLQFLR